MRTGATRVCIPLVLLFGFANATPPPPLILVTPEFRVHATAGDVALPGLHLRLMEMRGDKIVATALSDENGNAKFQGLRGRYYRVEAVGPPLHMAVWLYVPKQNERVDAPIFSETTLDYPTLVYESGEVGARLVLFADSKEQPLKDVHVDVLAPVTGALLGKTRTDDSGQFRLSLDSDGLYLARVRKDALKPSRSADAYFLLNVRHARKGSALPLVRVTDVSRLVD